MKKYVYIVGLSEFASRMNFMALTALILTFPNKEWLFTAFFLVRQIGALLMSPIAGKLADRFDRRKLMLISDFANGFAVLLPLVGTSSMIVISAFILGCTNQSFYIGYEASIPDMFGKDRGYDINALIVRIASFASIIGFIIGGWVTEKLGILPVIVFDSITYFVATIFLYSISWTSSLHQRNKEIGKLNKKKDALEKNKISSEVKWLLIILFFFTLAVSGYNFSLPLWAETYNQPSLVNGVFWAILSLGSFVGSMMNKKSVNMKSLAFIFLAFALSLVFSFTFKTVYVAVPLLFFVGFFEGRSQIISTSLLQMTSSVQRGRIFGLQGVLTRTGFLIGFILCPISVSILGISGNVWALQSLLMVCAITYLIYEKWGLFKSTFS
ncbi:MULTISPECIES: MFS transporter [unclassified Bacillus (in: firmicutes)]|uniref:MFS transporter n=1 Tax=unclassified Bacillus (in: firmicutes) TaxID=185979 RepID=UPI0008E43539|nr:MULTISPECIES: MFS transporter [unclassified Bacillus (in: firmicutes)]SFA77131.1 Predicted arabinose efflux permease, MFS family [Bacillus sp. UNCCL13]SFQ67030.1 Predicted arabinose efflux permease, MFS family [Bacillus sp. cl95]